MIDRIAWPVDMRGWERVGYYADLEIWAKGNLRRLIEKDGSIVCTYEVAEGDNSAQWPDSIEM